MTSETDQDFRNKRMALGTWDPTQVVLNGDSVIDFTWFSNYTQVLDFKPKFFKSLVDY